MCLTSAASSATSISLMRTRCNCVFALKRATLNSFPSVLVCKLTTSVDGPKVYNSIRETNMPKSVVARTHPCFTLLRISKGSDVAPS